MSEQRFTGFHEIEDLPIKRGDIVTVPKGVIVKRVGEEPRPAGRSQRVKVHHLLPGCTETVDGETRSILNPSVVWAGSGGYWHEVDINDIPEANQ